MSSNPPNLFESWHVTDVIVGIPALYLNMFLKRKLYGITASVSGRRGTKSSRRFDEDSVFGIALVWMLFESGLRTEPIRRILNEIAENTRADAIEAAQVLLSAQVSYLVIIRELRNQGHEALKVTSAEWKEEIAEFVADNPAASVQVFPVGQMFAEIEGRMEVAQLLQEKRG